MVLTFLETLHGLFDRRFVLAFWAPTFVAATCCACIAIIGVGASRALAWWQGMGLLEQASLGLFALLVITILAYILSAFGTTVLRWYEGYRLPPPFRQWGQARQEYKRAELVASNDNAAWQHLYFYYPRSPSRIRSTRLGNVLTSAEEYAFNVYGLDSIIWWPRLTALLPSTFLAQIDASVVPVLALLNMCTLITLISLIGGLSIFIADDRGWFFIAVFGGGILVARLCYKAAVARAIEYGSLIRSAFDLYRFNILEQMRVPAPTDLVAERHLWTVLSGLTYQYIEPWWNPPLAASQPTQLVDPATYPFTYAHQPLTRTLKDLFRTGRSAIASLLIRQQPWQKASQFLLPDRPKQVDVVESAEATWAPGNTVPSGHSSQPEISPSLSADSQQSASLSSVNQSDRAAAHRERLEGWAGRVAMSWVISGVILVALVLSLRFKSNWLPNVPRGEFARASLDIPAYTVINASHIASAGILLPPNRAMSHCDTLGRISIEPIEQGDILTADMVMQLPDEPGGWAVVVVPASRSVQYAPGQMLSVFGVEGVGRAVGIAGTPAADAALVAPSPSSLLQPSPVLLTDRARLLDAQGDNAVLTLPTADADRVVAYLALGSDHLVVVGTIKATPAIIDSATPSAGC